MSGLSIHLLGRPEIACDGRPVTVERRKTLALIAYVALQARPCDRQGLGTLLWPDAGPGDATAYLRNALWLIKKTPISSWLDMEGTGIALRPLFLDVLVFRQRVREAGPVPVGSASSEWPGARQLAEAIDLYRGDFMAGFVLKGNADFEDWQFRQEESLRRVLIESLAKLVAYYEARHEILKATHYACRWLETDPLDEQAQARMMVLQARMGRRGEALRFFARCERRLRDELDVLPSARMLQLCERIRSGDIGELTATARPAPPRRAPADSPASLAGRERETEVVPRRWRCRN